MNKQLNSFELGAFAIIFDDQKRVLLCHRTDYDLWNLPGGALDQGEAPWDAVVRETKEEVGLEVEVEQLAGVYFKPDQDDLVFSFICKVVGGQLQALDEMDQTEYFAFKNIPKNTVPRQVERIEDALKGVGFPLLKIQSGPTAFELIKQGKL